MYIFYISYIHDNNMNINHKFKNKLLDMNEAQNEIFMYYTTCFASNLLWYSKLIVKMERVHLNFGEMIVHKSRNLMYV